MVIDHKMLVGRERIHARRRFAQSFRRARHPLFEGSGDWLQVARRIYRAVEMPGAGQLSKTVIGCFDSITEIREAIERRGQTWPVNEESRKPRRVVGMSPRRKPRLNI